MLFYKIKTIGLVVLIGMVFSLIADQLVFALEKNNTKQVHHTITHHPKSHHNKKSAKKLPHAHHTHTAAPITPHIAHSSPPAIEHIEPIAEVGTPSPELNPLNINELPANNKNNSTFISSITQRVVGLVHSTIATLRYTAYKLGGTRFDRTKGIYVLDCSDYVDHILKAAYPAAYLSLVHSSGSDKPTTEHYYDFFTRLSNNSQHHHWNKVDEVSALQPGDILVFRRANRGRAGMNGHVMVVMNKPIQIQDAFIVKVADSASSRHSQDTRLPHTSGIGIGKMQLKVDPESGQPLAYAWRLGSTWEKHVNFAMARPIG
jgi:cell wall-associated NlpC family hydrolase